MDQGIQRGTGIVQNQVTASGRPLADIVKTGFWKLGGGLERLSAGGIGQVTGCSLVYRNPD